MMVMGINSEKFHFTYTIETGKNLTKNIINSDIRHGYLTYNKLRRVQPTTQMQRNPNSQQKQRLGLAKQGRGLSQEKIKHLF